MPKKTQFKQINSDPDDGGQARTNREEDEFSCLDLALEKLNAQDRGLIFQYYSAKGLKLTSRNDLANSLGIGVKALEIRVRKIRATLQYDLNKCLNELSPPQSTAGRLTELIPVIEQIRRLEPSLISHLKQHNDDLLKINPLLFEHLFAEFLAAQGFDDVRLVGRNPKTSADIYATRCFVGPDIPMKLFVEVKRWKATIGIEVINQVLGAYLGERERFGWNAALIVTVGGFRDFEKWSREELELKGLYLRDRDDLLRYLDGYKEHDNGLWLPNPRTDL